MSSRRTSSSASKITEDEINNLIMKLRPLLPRLNQRRNGTVPASEVVKETCNYIRSLQSEADDLSERLSQLLGSTDSNGVDITLIINLLQQQY
ncbi:hypothetical protein WN943_013235 [Citrus x changshan-huyou]